MDLIDYFNKARQAKYISRTKGKDGKWIYKYKEDNKIRQKADKKYVANLNDMKKNYDKLINLLAKKRDYTNMNSTHNKKIEALKYKSLYLENLLPELERYEFRKYVESKTKDM